MKQEVKTSYKRESNIVRGIDLIRKVKNEPRPRMIWDGIPEGSMGLITGVAKTGKTTFAENLAMSLSIGRKEFFGKPLSGKPKKVLFINLEESYRIKSWRNEKQVSEFSEEEFELFCENYISTPIDFPEFLIEEADWEKLRNYILESKAEIIFIDSLTHMFTEGSIERSSDANKFVQKLNIYLKPLNKTFVIIHHNVKGNEKPIEQDNIAGSRVILQKFHYAYGFAHIPKGGSYTCMLNNKFISCDSSKATVYRIDENNWVTSVSTTNKFELYKDTFISDGRKHSINQDLVYEYVESQTSQGSPNILTSNLMNSFVDTSIMSRDTLHQCLNRLQNSEKIIKVKKGVYKLNDMIDGAGK